MVRHIVSWNFKPELTEQQRKELAVQVVERLNAFRDRFLAWFTFRLTVLPWTAATVTWCSIPRSPARRTCPPTRPILPTRQFFPLLRRTSATAAAATSDFIHMEERKGEFL